MQKLFALCSIKGIEVTARRGPVPLLRLGGVVDAFVLVLRAFEGAVVDANNREAHRLGGMCRALRREAWAMAGVGLDSMAFCLTKTDAALLARRAYLVGRLAEIRRHHPTTWRAVAHPLIDELRAVALTLRIRRRYAELDDRPPLAPAAEAEAPGAGSGSATP